MGKIIEKFRMFRWGSLATKIGQVWCKTLSKEKVPNSVGQNPGMKFSFSVLRIRQPVGQIQSGKPFLFGLNRAEKVGNRRKNNGPTFIHPVAPGKDTGGSGFDRLGYHGPASLFFQIISFLLGGSKCTELFLGGELIDLLVIIFQFCLQIRLLWLLCFFEGIGKFLSVRYQFCQLLLFWLWQVLFHFTGETIELSLLFSGKDAYFGRPLGWQ